MFEDERLQRAITCGVLFGFGIAALAVLFTPFPIDPAGWLVGLIWFDLIWSLVMFVGFLSNLISWLSHDRAELAQKKRDMDTQTAFERAVAAVAKLPADYLAYIPDFDHFERITFTDNPTEEADDDSEEANSYYLETPDGPVPWWFVDDFLKRSSNVECLKMETYSEGTKEHAWIRGLHKLAWARHYAIFPTGPYSSRWIGNGRHRAAKKWKIILDPELNEPPAYASLPDKEMRTSNPRRIVLRKRKSKVGGNNGNENQTTQSIG